MEIRQLKYFVEVCRHKSFTRAAEACYLSTQGISMAMLRLEHECGRQLFLRDKQGVTLTPAAEFLLPRARRILELSGECEAYFATGADYHAVLPVACAPGSLEEFAGDLIAQFQEAHPDIRLEIRELCDEDCERAVAEGRVELGFSCGPVSPGQFEAQLLAVSPHALIVARDSPLARKEQIAAEDLRGLPLILLRSTTKTYSVIRSGCQMRGFEPIVDTFVDNILTVYDLAQTKRNAVGVSTMALASRLNRPRLKAVPLADPVFHWCLHFIRRKDRELSAPARLFEQAVLDRREAQGVLRLPAPGASV